MECLHLRRLGGQILDFGGRQSTSGHVESGNLGVGGNVERASNVQVAAVLERSTTGVGTSQLAIDIDRQTGVNVHEADVGPLVQRKGIIGVTASVPVVLDTRANVDFGGSGVEPDSGATLHVGTTLVEHIGPLVLSTQGANPESVRVLASPGDFRCRKSQLVANQLGRLVINQHEARGRGVVGSTRGGGTEQGFDLSGGEGGTTDTEVRDFSVGGLVEGVRNAESAVVFSGDSLGTSALQLAVDVHLEAFVVVVDGHVGPVVEGQGVTGVTTFVPAASDTRAHMESGKSGVEPDSGVAILNLVTLLEDVGPVGLGAEGADPERVEVGGGGDGEILVSADDQGLGQLDGVLQDGVQGGGQHVALGNLLLKGDSDFFGLQDTRDGTEVSQFTIGAGVEDSARGPPCTLR
eukprot:TRINITY_DN14_c0_g1_i1.p1 TRINITY_DN14_c0_g1~~TRINITY_DN14_c0_g1_i1.p1  ORF type:complete len:407 (+),score=9.45 TRINITY_DN14_c0_g1_i1:80-1300(+)